jgi:predicted small integral membrane protein
MMAGSHRWRTAFAIVVVVFLIAVGLLVSAVPLKDGVRDWFAPLVAGGWMAWTFPTAAFFLTIFALLSLMAVWEYASPGGHPRVGILHFETTRGDRLFVSLLGSAFIHLAWLGLVGPGLWWALALSVVYAIAVFRYV